MTARTSSRWNPFQRHVLGSTAEESDQIVQPGLGSKSKTWATTVTRVPSWPEEARSLGKHTWISWILGMGDVILVLLPIYFILLGIAVITLNGEPVDGNVFASKVTSAIQLGPTLFPIMFAAISGRSMKMIARYLAEKGAKLSTLELLAASQSVWGTVESQLLMRRLTLVGANLLFLWAMSPIGGQASLRLLEKSTSTAQYYTPLRYLSTGPGSAVWAMTSGTYVESDGGLTQVEALYASALLASSQVKGGPEDNWGSVKIPYLNASNASKTDSDGWITVPSDLQRPEDYSSLVGIPVMGRPLDQDGTFTLETSQLDVECEPFVRVPANKFNYTELEKLVPGQIWKNMSDDNSPWGGNSKTIGGKTATFFLQTDLPLTDGGDDGDGRFNSFTGFVNKTMKGRAFPKRKITYASSYGFGFQGNTTLGIANCSLGQVHTETVVKCTMDQCSAVQIRPSRSDFRDGQVTAFDHILIAQLALTAFPKTFGWSRGSNPTEQFLFNTSSFRLVSPTANYGDNAGWVDLSSLAPDVFARRLALLLNTYYQLTIAPNAYLGNLPQANFSAFGPDTLPVKDVDAYLPSNISVKNTTFPNWYTPFQDKTYNEDLYFIGATTNATISKTHDIFVCNFAWLGMLFIAASIVFITGVACLCLKRQTLGPDMFGFVTSMTYENQYVKLPIGGSMLDAMERARLLKDVEVYVGDVCGEEEVGHIAFATGVPPRKLDRERLYC
ncbi:hypothetical protein P153DRAFT_188919 [Dothidotthia symphoricarpi CBS 119687]|uniref:Uncharacterized protein n=1 Tax=Dothidotthia symphoricarpi CBS 119687 TaxID=1392245 RepID=A0A6A6AMC8_9PLEO|nr:uncharacterized protein P153DRAFT_188919 [Dothidotthia symphoricarpi CBS 119687]KAF2132323.1 hypothetical protein P153DRAFT_188919 [Dothidotthia symphoricarpi CBS 119687]